MPLLTRQQFANTAVGQRPGASYQNYVSYVTRTQAARAAALANDPMAAFNQAMKLPPAQAEGDIVAIFPDFSPDGSKLVFFAGASTFTRQASM